MKVTSLKRGVNERNSSGKRAPNHTRATSLYFICLNRGRSAGFAASNAFQRTIRAPCDSKNARSSGVKNEEPSCRRLNSRRSRPSGFRNLVRTSWMKNFQSASVHSSHSPFSRRPIRWKHTRCAVTRSNCLPKSGKGSRALIRAMTRLTPKNLVVPRKKGSSSGSSPRPLWPNIRQR